MSEMLNRMSKRLVVEDVRLISEQLYGCAAHILTVSDLIDGVSEVMWYEMSCCV